MSKPSIIIVGPAACGKTRNAEALRHHYGLERVIDDYYGQHPIPSHGALVLATQGSPIPSGVQVVQYKEAAQVAGV